MALTLITAPALEPITLAEALPPGLSAEGSCDGASVHFESRGEVGECSTARVKLAGRLNLPRRQSGGRMILPGPRPLSPLRKLVIRVGLRVAEHQMIRTHARWVVAPMHDHRARSRKRSVQELVGDPMRGAKTARHANVTVAVQGPRPDPLPAVVRAAGEPRHALFERPSIAGGVRVPVAPHARTLPHTWASLSWPCA